MGNTAPLKYSKPFFMRVDDEFEKAIGEIQRASTDKTTPAKADVVRDAVFKERDRLRKAAERRK